MFAEQSYPVKDPHEFSVNRHKAVMPKSRGRVVPG